MARYRKVTLEGDVVQMLFDKYREKGHPMGKNRRGRKKWISAFCRKLLREMMDDIEQLRKNRVDNKA